MNRTDNQDQIWVSVDAENEWILNNETYDAFLLLPLYMAMYYHTDLKINGKVSKKLYKNVMEYLQPILCSFSDKLNKVNVFVDGFQECPKTQQLIGTGLSCGIDSLSTVYRYFEKEDDPDYRLNSLFMFNCGWHGEYGEESTIALYKDRALQNKKAADAMGLKYITVDSNLHAFLPYLDDQVSYFALYTCAFAMEKGLKRYYIASSYDYSDVMRVGYKSRNRDFSEYADPMALPLLRSDSLELVSDGLQQRRTEKTEMIADWSIAQKYLNVCCNNETESNCCTCVKCIRTLIPLQAMGKIGNFSETFDLEKWNKISADAVNKMVINKNVDAFARDNYMFCLEHGVSMPSMLKARIHFLPVYMKRLFSTYYLRKLLKKR